MYFRGRDTSKLAVDGDLVSELKDALRVSQQLARTSLPQACALAFVESILNAC
jgi:hypothetical protein